MIITGIVFFVFAAGFPVYAADPNYTGSYDLEFDETTIQELQEWARLYWEWYDTGVVPPGAANFQFTDPSQFPPGFHPFNEALGLFERIYAHLLDLDMFSAGYYDIWDLFEDNPVILAQFRYYTETGKLPFAMPVDPSSWGRSGPSGKKVPVGSTPPLLPGNVPADVIEFGKKLKDAVNGSGISNGGIPYVPDPKFPWEPGGFDCDDFADALVGWVVNDLGDLYPGMTIFHVWVLWGSETWIGHFITIVVYNGYYWIIDAQTGMILGPFMVPTPINPRPILEAGYSVPPDTPVVLRSSYCVGDRPKCDPDPWWDNPLMRDHVQNSTGNDWRDYVPPGFP